MSNENNCYQISWEGLPDRQWLQEALENVSGLEPQSVRRIIEGEVQQWPNRRTNMARMSRDWPDVVFTIDILNYREYYRNGLVQEVSSILAFPDFCPDDLREPTGIGTLSTANLARTSLPDPRFRCEGAECGFQDLEDIHFTDDRDHEDQPEDLYYAELVDEEYAMETRGFFCLECLKTAGLQPEGRPTLTEIIITRSKT